MNNMRIGYTASGYDFTGDPACNVGEIRYFYSLDQTGCNKLLDMNKANNIFTILNIGMKKVTFSTPNRPDPNFWYLNEYDYKTYVRSLIVKALSKGFNKKTLAIAVENEPTKYFRSQYNKSWADYLLYIKWLNEVMSEFNFPFDIGVCNDEGHKRDFFEYVCMEMYNYFQIIYYHLQACAMDKPNTDSVLSFMLFLKNKYDKIISCNEATWYDTQTVEGWNLLLYQILEAEKIDTKDFCLFIDYKGSKITSMRCEFKLNGIPRDIDKWNGLKRIMLERKGGEINMYLKEFKKGDKDFQVRALQKSLNSSLDVNLKVDGDFGSKTETEVMKFNTENNISSVVKCSYATWYELLQDLQTEIIVKDLIDLIKAIE